MAIKIELILIDFIMFKDEEWAVFRGTDRYTLSSHNCAEIWQ